jgi:hypothetical protein
MEPFIMKEYPDYIFHMKDGRCILQHNKKNGHVYVSYREIWKFFESYFSMSDQQIKDITKIWVEEQYKMGVTSTRMFLVSNGLWVEEQYKMGVTSTVTPNYREQTEVEEHYKMGVTTTLELPNGLTKMVEKDYKMGVTTTCFSKSLLFTAVDEQYNLQTNG